MTLWNRSGVSVLALAILASCSLFRVTDPRISIEVTSVTDDQFFLFGVCGASWSTPRVTDLEVVDLVDGSVMCNLVIEGGTRGLQRWRYGEVPKAFSSAACRPLRKGGKYRILVGGGGGGSRKFVLTKDGTVLGEGSGCGG